MDDEKILEALKKFLQQNVASKIKLKKPPEDFNINSKLELIKPAVYIGWVPPKNYLNDYGYDVPSLLVMEDGGQDEGGEANLDIRIGIAIYDPGENKDGITIPNVNGYKGILKIINLIRSEMSKEALVNGDFTIQTPIKWGLYEEQNFPYWHGWVSFQVPIMPLSYQNFGTDKYL